MKLSQYAYDAMEAVQLGDLDRATFLLGQANTFRISAAHLAGEAASIVSGLGKFQFPKDLWSDKYKDPFKPWREKVRGFARTWDMDPVFRDMLG